MKKTVGMILLLVMAAIMMTACSSQGGTTASTPEPQVQAANPEENAPGDPSESVNITVHFGKVKDIIGNEFVLSLAEDPYADGHPTEENGGSAEGGGGTNDDSTMIAAALMQDATAVDAVQETEHMELTYLGEEKKFIVPAGTKIVDLTTGQEVQLSTLKKGCVIMVTMDSSKESIVEIAIWEQV